MNHKVESRTRSSYWEYFFFFYNKHFHMLHLNDDVRSNSVRRESARTWPKFFERNFFLRKKSSSLELWNIKVKNIRKKIPEICRSLFSSHRRRLPVFIIIYLYYYIYCTNTIRSLGMEYEQPTTRHTKKK
jgi:hypothetical protein